MRQHHWAAIGLKRIHLSLIVMIVMLFSGCASLPPGSDFPKNPSIALAHPEETHLGRQFEQAARLRDQLKEVTE